MKKQLRKSKLWLLTLLAMIVGASPAWAQQKTLPYSYGFEDYNLATDGWTTQNPSGLNNSEFAIVGDAKKTGSYGFRFSSYSNRGKNTQYLISPELSTPTGVDVTFAYAGSSSSGNEVFKVGYSTTDTEISSFIFGDEIATNKSTSWQTYEGSFPAGTKYIAVYYYANWQYRLYVDDFTFSAPPTCIKPTGLSTSDLTSSSVTLSWTSDADAWNLQYKEVADADWTTVENISTKSYILSSLNPATSYQVCVQTNCGSGDLSDWTDAVSFTTDCATIIIDADQSFSEDFSAGNTLPNCWTINNENKGSSGNGWTISSNMGFSGYYGDTYLILPPMQLSVASQFVFDNYFNFASDYNGTTAKSSIVISTTGTAAADFTTTLYTFDKSELPSSSSTSLPKEISLAAYTGQTVYLAFKYEGNNAHAWYVDNVVVEQAPNCVKPTSLTASNVLYDRATLSWTAGSDETEWKIIWGAADFDPASGGTTVSSITENSYTLTGLSQETSYDVYVKAVKGSDESVLSDKATFTTTERYPAPTGLAIDNLTATSATLTWNAGAATSWEVAINTTGVTPATEAGTGTVVNTSTYNFSELTAETTHFAFVREKDGENYSNWSAACEFTPSAYTYLTVNEGTDTNNYIPIYANGIWSSTKVASQFLILSTALTDMVNCELKKMTFYSSSDVNNFGGGKFEVYLAEVNNTTVSSTKDWTEMTKVYNEGTLSVSGSKMTIVFDNVFEYKGGNLLVGIKQTVKDQNGTNLDWYGVTTTNNMSRYVTGTENKKFSPKVTIGYQAKTGSELKVFDGETELTSPASFDFELAAEGTTHTFTLKNTAATPYVATITSTNLTVSPAEVTPTAEGVTITVTMPAQSITEEAVVITPANESGLDPFTILVSGSIKEAGKFEEDFSGNALPNGWTKTDYNSTYKWTFTNGYASAPFNECSLTTPMLSFTAGEKFFFDACNNYSWGTSGYVKIQTSADGESFADLQTFSAEADLVYNTMKTYSVTIPSADVKYVRFLAKYSIIDNVYGGEKVPGASFAINTDGTTQDFGSVKANTTAQKTYTITNGGDKPLFVSIENPYGFTAEMTKNENDKNVYFTDAQYYGDVNVYYWPNGGDWPGKPMTYLYTNDQNQKVYYYQLPDDVDGGIIFNGNGRQTVDITKNFYGYAYYTTEGTDDMGHDHVGTWDFNNCVPAGKSSTLTITMNTETAGDKSGNVVLTFDALNANSFVIPCTGNVKDPNLLMVDFSDYAFPENWQVGNNWSATTGSAVQSGTSATAFITTPLTVADGETMTFKVKRNASGVSNTGLQIRYSQDGGVNWTDYTTYYNSNDPNYGSSFTTKTVSGITAGTVIFEFLGCNIVLDDIEGFIKTTKPALAVTESSAAVANGDTKDLGNLHDDGTAVYTIKNIGNATLKADITAQDGVTVNTASIEIGAGQTADITVTMAFAEPYGAKTGAITIDAEDEWISDFVVNFTANLVDPTDFVEDFTAGKPAGWYNGGWTFNGETASITLGAAKDLITKKLEAATGKDQLTFKAKYSNENLSKTLNVYTSTDRMNWTLSKEVTLTADYADVTLDALDAGYYYVKFEAANAVIDDVKGLKNVDLPAHDLYLVSSTLPTDQITPLDDYTATVNVASLVAEETVAAELYFGETKVAELTGQTIASGATKAFTLTGKAPAAGDFQVYAKVYNGEVTVKTEKVTVTVADKTELSLTNFTAVTKNVQADNNNEFTAEFNVTVKNTGSTAFTADQVSVTVTDGDNNDLKTATWAPGQTIYLKAGDYTAADANLAIYRWNSEGSEWALFTAAGDGIYTADLNGKDYFIICRVNPEISVNDLSFNDGVCWNKSGDLTTTQGVVFENNGYTGQYNKDLNLTQSNNFIAGMSATISVTVTADAGNGGTKSFNAKENVSNVYWSPGKGYLQEVNVTAAPAIVLNENGDGTFATGTNRKVSLSRTFVAGWNTVCLPFSFEATEIDANAKALELTAFENNELTFSPVTELEANKPYVIYVPNAITEAIEFTGKTVVSSNELATTINGLTFQGTYTQMTAGTLENKWGLTAAGKIAEADDKTTMKGFRAYFDGIKSLASARVRFIGFNDDVPTGISNIIAVGSAEGVYNLQGQKVEQLKKGSLYIINGKKQIVK